MGKNNEDSHLLLLMGRQLALINEAEPLPQQNSAWENQVLEEMRKVAIPNPQIAKDLQNVAQIVHTALGSLRYDTTYSLLRDATNFIKSMCTIQNFDDDRGFLINDPYFVGKQVVSRYPEQEILYGRVRQTLVHLRPQTYDTWVVEIRPGFQLNGESSAFLRYDGPRYQPGDQVLYHGKPATILGPTFSNLARGSFGFHILMTSTEEEKYDVPFTDLSTA